MGSVIKEFKYENGSPDDIKVLGNLVLEYNSKFHFRKPKFLRELGDQRLYARYISKRLIEDDYYYFTSLALYDIGKPGVEKGFRCEVYDSGRRLSKRKFNKLLAHYIREYGSGWRR